MVRDYSEALKKTVEKATDATLLSDNWQYILDVCDKVDEEPENGSREVIQLVSLRLQQRDANVQLRTLSLLTSIAENCGSRVKQEIATKSFTSLLLNRLREPTVHNEIKIKIVQVLTQLSKSFSNDSSLKPIQDAYKEVELHYSQYFPPSKPKKQNLDTNNLRQEEEDLKAAIALSLAENNQASIPTTQDIQHQQQQQPQQFQAPQGQVSQGQAQQAPQGQGQPKPISKAQPSFSRVRALYDSFSQDPADLHFRKGDIITILERVYKDWGKGSLRGEIGLFPFNYVTPIYDPTMEELQQESQKEVEILNQSRKVEKLLSLLNNGNDDIFISNEFQQLYQETVLIKPELSGLIEKYRVRRDELLDLHGKLKNASIKYEELTDPLKNSYQQQSLSQPQPPQPHQVHQSHPQTTFPNQSPSYQQTPQTPHTPHTPQQVPQSTGQYPQYPSQYQAPQVPQIPQIPQTTGYQQQSPQIPQIPQVSRIPQVPQTTGSGSGSGSISNNSGIPNLPQSSSLAQNLQQQSLNYGSIPQQQQQQQQHGSQSEQRPYPQY